VLKFLNFKKLFKVHTYANDFAISGVFMEDGHPIDFESEKALWNIIVMAKLMKNSYMSSPSYGKR
jgi:hypothetical protein